jgi:hypothetical protein
MEKCRAVFIVIGHSLHGEGGRRNWFGIYSADRIATWSAIPVGYFLKILPMEKRF